MPKRGQGKKAKPPVEKGDASVQLSFKNRDKGFLGKKGKTRSQTLRQMIRAEEYEKYPPNVPTYTSMEVPPSQRPALKYCDITGFVANYTDPKTGLRYCAADVYQYIQVLPWDKVQQYLKLRGKSVIS